MLSLVVGVVRFCDGSIHSLAAQELKHLLALLIGKGKC